MSNGFLCSHSLIPGPGDDRRSSVRRSFVASLSDDDKGSCVYLDLPFFTHQKTTAKTIINSKAPEQLMMIIDVSDNPSEASEGSGSE